MLQQSDYCYLCSTASTTINIADALAPVYYIWWQWLVEPEPASHTAGRYIGDVIMWEDKEQQEHNIVVLVIVLITYFCCLCYYWVVIKSSSSFFFYLFPTRNKGSSVPSAAAVSVIIVIMVVVFHISLSRNLQKGWIMLLLIPMSCLLLVELRCVTVQYKVFKL